MKGLSSHELDRLLLALIDDVISAEDHRQLQDTLLASQAARDRYLELASLHNLLEQLEDAPVVVTVPRPFSVKGPLNQPLPRRPVRTRFLPLPLRRPVARLARSSMRLVTYRMIGPVVRNRPLLATAAMLVMGIIFMSWKLVPDAPMARVISSRGSVLTISHPQDLKKPLKPNTLGPGSSIELAQGTVELTFSSGVRGIFQAPETITLTDERHLTLKRGAAWFHVPPGAVGFEVLTPHLQVVDLGTEFGVVSREDGSDEVHVFTGKVEASARHGEAARETLVAGESCVVSTEGKLTKIQTKPELFLTTLPATLPYLHWTFDEADIEHLAAGGSHPAAGHISSKLVAPGGSATFASIPGKFGRALSTTGRNGYVETDWPGIGGNAPRTIAYWLKLPPGPQYHLIVAGWGTRRGIQSPRAFLAHIKTQSHGTNAGASVDGFWNEGSTPIDDGRWHHLAVVYSGRSKPDGDPEIYCYVDGQLEPVTRHSSDKAPMDSGGNLIVDTDTTSPNAQRLCLFSNPHWGGAFPVHGFTLAIDELHVFEAALSEHQIHNLYRSNEYHPE